MNIAFIGLGVMGNPMCANLIEEGSHRVAVFDLDDSKIDILVSMGAIKASTMQQAISESDLVLTSLPGPKQVQQVAFGENGIFQNIQTAAAWIDLSTNNLDICGLIVAQAQKQGVEFLDCPVSGGDEGAKAGTLTILAGGDKQVYEKFLPVLEVLGESISWLGKSGAGYSAKIAQVVLCYLHSLALSEALMLGIKGGVEARKMLEIIQNSTGKSYVADRYGPPILAGDYDPSFTIGLAHKDMKLAQEMAENLGIQLPMCDLTTSTYARAIDEYGFDANHLKAVRLLEQDNDTYLRG
jgi:3-hydroxyisobutyrate dehydrogenase-like beta-hydroxyacid dehydrogenase